MKNAITTFLLAAALSATPAVAADSPCPVGPIDLQNIDIECVEYTREKATQGYANAQSQLGWMYYNGKGVTKDFREAVRWYRAAAEQGDAYAQNNLGAMYQEGEGVAEDFREAVRWYRAAAEQGYATPQYQLGVMYYYGLGVARDEREAARWYRAAAEQGDTEAQFTLGWMYENGEGVEKDAREAVRWYRAAAEQGVALAQYNLGRMYYNGKGVVEEQREAYIWLLIAKAGGEEVNLRGFSWQLTSAEIKSIKREAVRRFEEIENRKNDTEYSDDNSAEKGGGEFAIAKPPEQKNIAAEVFENTWRSVVMVKDGEGQGGGVIIRPNLVATNCHVVEGDDITVYKPQNRRIKEDMPFYATVVHRNETHDFCILEVKELWGIAATIRKYDTLKVGENVYALGAPQGYDLSLSNGLVSQLRTTDDGVRYIQTDAAISPGSSGGGLFDVEGNFIGILTSKNVEEKTEGIGFAIPADLSLEF